jgi:hypothetical protein
MDVGQLEVTGIQLLTEGQQPTQHAAAGLVNVLWVCCIGHKVTLYCRRSHRMQPGRQAGRQANSR